MFFYPPGTHLGVISAAAFAGLLGGDIGHSSQKAQIGVLHPKAESCLRGYCRRGGLWIWIDLGGQISRTKCQRRSKPQGRGQAQG